MTEINKEQFSEIIKEDKINIIKFGADWCCECRELGKKLEKISQDFSDMGFYELDVSKNMDLADEYKIDELPVLISFRKGKETSRLVESFNDIEGWLKMLTW